ncbi:MAG TPA: dTDP-4-dehydrorhamnose reductase [Solirubrobacterales bacterium]|nr:dTDP-4-dehydrorhamnose reductase [Solirubrobacterales bacterium]
MKILVTGAAGMLGSDVVRAAEFVNHEVVGLAHADLDVTDRQAVERTLLQERPDAVINCAAYTDVDGAEDDLGAAMDVNAEAAAHVAATAAEIGARVLYPSSDYVFDGHKSEPYVESDAPRPQSIYAQSKLAGEHETAAANPRHYIARSAWLFGRAGRNFVETMLSLARDHGEVLVVRDQVGSPTYTAHLADALVRLVDTEAYGIHHLASQGECSWFEFAREIFKQAGVRCRVMSCTTDEFGRPAPRPAYSVLATEREDALYLPHWREGLASYLAERSVTA